MLLSIIVPVYNSERYIASCIESILCQKNDNYELILIDDGSADKSGEICEAYAQKHGHISYKRIENNGVSNARNVGISMAKGEYIQFVDSDDKVMPSMTEQILRKLRDENSPDIIIYEADIKNAEDKIIDKVELPSEGFSDIKTELERLNVKNKAAMLHYVWNRWYKRSVIQSNKISFDTGIDLGEDFLFNCEILKYCRNIYFMRSPLYVYYRRDGNSLTGKFRKDELQRRRIMFGSFCELYKHYGIYEKCADKLEIMEASIAVTSMESVGTKNCGLTYKEKRDYIEQFMISEYKGYICKAMKSESLHRSGKLYAKLLVHGMYGVFIAILKIRK